MPLVVGVDSSTSSCKVERRDADTGELVGSGRAPHPATTPPRSEQQPGAWWDAFESAALQADVLDGGQCDAISVAGQQHGLVALDVDGQVLRPAKLWNDTESADDAARLTDALGPAAWADACGSVPVASFTITKLAWLKRHEPENFVRLGRILLPHDWLTHRLTGAWTTDRGDVSGTGWWSPAEERYRIDLLDLVDDGVDWASKLPEVLGPTEPAGHWSANGAVVGPGTGDNMAAALGLGLAPGDVAISLGTSGTVFTVADRPSADPTGIVAGFADATGHHLPLVCTLNATKVTDAVARLLGLSPLELDELALTGRAGAGGVVLVPHFDGERTPNRPDATGTFSGLRSDVSREQIARSAFEGVVCNLLAGADELPGRGSGNTDDARIFLIGGGARSTAYSRVVADLTGRPVIVPDAHELVALGAAVQAAVVLTGSSFREVSDAWHLGAGQTIEPDTTVDAEAIRQAYAAAVEP